MKKPSLQLLIKLSPMVGANCHGYGHDNEYGVTHILSSKNTKQEPPGNSRTGLRLLSLWRGLTCILPLHHHPCVQIHIAPFIPLYSLSGSYPRQLAPTVGLSLISNCKDGFFINLFTGARPQARLQRDIPLRIVGLHH